MIDYLTWIEFEDEKLGYNKWINKRLFNICYRDKAEELYSVRCGLIHTYGPSKKILNQQFMGYHLRSCDTGLHLQRINNNILKICLYTLLTDVVYAAHMMFEEYKPLIPDDQLRRLKQQIGIDRTSAPHFYKDMHPALGVFDQYHPLTADHFRSGHSHHILWKA